MSALGAVLGKRTWLGAGAILLAAAGGCALGALLVVKGVLPEGGALAWGCGCWALAAFAGGRVGVRGRGEGTLTAALAAGAAAYLLAWLTGAAIGDPTFRTGGLYLTAAIFGGAGAKTPVSGIGVAHPAEAVMLTLRQVETIGDDLMLRYSVD